MPTQDLNEIDYEQKTRLVTYAQNSKALQESKALNAEELTNEANQEYSRTMNKIIFNEYFDDANKDLVPFELNIGEDHIEEVSYYGMINIPKANVTTESKEVGYIYPNTRDFTEIFKEFCFSSLFIKEEVIKALQEIKVACNEVVENEIFTLQFENIVRIEEFKTIQESSISQLMSHQKGGWINKMTTIIKEQFSEVGKGWFNMKETNRLTYEFGKLKRFLTVIRLNMQDTLYTLINKSQFGFYEFMKENIPEKVEINSESNVMNYYRLKGSDGIELIKVSTSDLSHKPAKQALVLIDLVKVTNIEEFNYSIKPEKIVKEILTLLEKALDELKAIPDLEPKIQESLHKAKKNETYVLTPILPKEEPEIPNPSAIPRRYPEDNKWVWDLYHDFKKLLMVAVQPLQEFTQQFDKYLHLLKIKPDQFVAELENDDEFQSAERIKQEIEKFQLQEENQRKAIPEEIHVSCFQINCKELIRFCCGKYQDLNKRLIDLIARRARESTARIFQQLNDTQKELRRNPANIEELTDLNEYIGNTLPNHIEKIKIETQLCMEVFDIQEGYQYKIAKEDQSKKWAIYGGPKEVNELIESREQEFKKMSDDFYSQMLEEQDEFNENLQNMESTINSFYINYNENLHEENNELVKSIATKLEEMQDTARMFSSREMLFDKMPTDFSKIGDIQKKFKPYYDLWTNVHCWLDRNPHWMNDEWANVDALGAEKFVEDGPKLLAGCLRVFKDKDPIENYEKVMALSSKSKNEIDTFKKKVPLLIALKRDGMKERHWEDISNKVGFKVEPTEGFNFTKVLEMGLMDHLALCEEVGERASREFAIETMLNKMYAQWDQIEFDLRPHGTTFLISGFGDIEQVLDEHLSNTQAMLINPFKKPFAEEIDEWYSKMVLVSNILEEWARFQQQWSYLQPIFDSPDIAKQLPNENNLFKRVDANWKHTMSQTKVQKNVLRICTSEGYLEKFKEANNTLEKIQKELNNYLEVKRSKFGRFYFLSNDDLQSILSQTKDVQRVQDHLRKVFESVARLDFDSGNKIHAMFSVEKEKVDFVKVLDPNHKQVEEWMGDVESMMMQSVRHALDQSIIDYTQKKRNEWIQSHAGQCVLNGSQVHWTTDVEEAIKSRTVRDYYSMLEIQLKELVLIERNGLSGNELVTIEGLIVIDVHAQDTVEKLIKANIDDVGAFEWISQLRYYWEKQSGDREDCYVKCIQTNFPYGYEYLGNTARLVITALTDKCYMTLMGALVLNLGGAPAGPAGTGKTESTKDLAKALAKQCVVFNCQESMGYQFVGKFFKGLASSGAWCCFDEFNRINLEVLSVIAQQLQELFRAKAEGVTALTFEGSDIRIIGTFSIFITMNPGYAGRTELPDNLKAQFRPVAMMVPDYAIIGEIKLYSFGFVTARDLARKMVATFKLASEQLSSQNHYDYGMRAVISVINAAGLLKKGNISEMTEDMLLLRALRDVNIPKFLSFDIPLFANIIKDLFPETEQPVYQYGSLVNSIQKACDKFNYEQVDVFKTKIQQLYDTIQVRHGLMIVGLTGAGKTCNYRTLQEAISSLHEEPGFFKVKVEILNPKSITMAELYGEYKDLNWNDGIIENIVERAINNQYNEEHGSDRYWIMFDGPVDALWIESMNTVLDDNKKLCLSSGKVLILSNFMTMMFEVEDLKVASPATVSRCGMVYMEPVSLGLKPLIYKYKRELPPLIKAIDGFENRMDIFVNRFLDDAIVMLRKKMKECVKTMDNNLVNSQCNMLSCFLDYYHEDETTKRKPEEVELVNLGFENLFVFCFIWSICCTCDNDGRKMFSEFVRKKIKPNPEVTIPEEGEVYDWCYDLKTNAWTHWTEPYESFVVDAKIGFADIVVPTIDYARMNYLQKTLFSNKKHVLCPGPIGTGKSMNAMDLISKGLTEQFTSMSIALSAQTTANQLLNTIFNQVDKRKRGVYGPSGGKKLICFVDDLNMPKKEVYFAQPPLELLRQFLDHKSWYIFKLNKELIRIDDLVLFTAMGPPGGGRQFITDRMIRHFNLLVYTELEESVIKSIFSKMLTSFQKNFPGTVKDQVNNLIDSTIVIYDNIKNDLLPIPSKSHYLFNLRDIAKVFAGICSGHAKFINSKEVLVRLWYHENMRVFYDRLTTQDDRDYLVGEMKKQFSRFEMKDEDVINSERIIFCDFQMGREGERFYSQAVNLRDFVGKLEIFQEDYNSEATSGKKQMKLILFLDACEHISRISRVLRQPQGHALLLGVGGSGRQSLTKLAVYISNYKLFQIEVIKGYNMAKWREDIKRLIYTVIVDNKPMSFLYVDTQIINEQMVEDINCLLNAGMVIGLPFNVDEQKKIDDIAKADCQRKQIPANKINQYQQQVARVKANNHIVFAMSPLGEEFLNRLRMFPAFVNCCTIDWFTEWPEEALIGVGEGALVDFEEELDIKGLISPLVQMFKFIHKSVERITIRYRAELRRHNYVTPTSYQEQLNLFKIILGNKNEENTVAINRLKNGIKKQRQANEDVEALQERLKREEPILKQTEEDVKIMLVKLSKDREEADEAKRVVAKEEDLAKQSEKEATEIATMVQTEVEAANIDLEKTLEKISLLTQNNLNEINSFLNPPFKIKFVMIALSFQLLTSKETATKANMDELEFEAFFWDLAKKTQLSNSKVLLDKLQNYDKNNIDPLKIKKIGEHILNHPKRNQKWTDQEMQGSNKANYYLFLFVNSIIQYHEFYEKTKPLRAKYDECMLILEEKKQFLALKMEELDKVNKKLKELQDLYDEKIAQMDNLKKQIDECNLKLERAKRLTDLLSDENERWQEEIVILENKSKLLPGNTVIAAGMVAYSGPFTSHFRTELEADWIEQLVTNDLKHTEKISMKAFLGDAVKIQTWNIAGLPKDDTSIENGIIIDQTRRWPQMIDPQTQANKFIKNQGRDHQEGLDIVKASATTILRQIEQAIQFGKWIIVENVGTSLDPALEPILLQQVFKSGGQLSITIGDKSVPYDEHFKFFMTTTNPNPHYSPETCAKVTIINFGITPSGLEEQMLATIVILENRQLEDQKNEIVRKNAADKRMLINLEDDILKTLSESKGDILMDVSLINKLATSKKTSGEIKQRVQESKLTEERIDKAREGYRRLAYRSSIQFFSIVDLSTIDPMYQYSLQWFEQLFKMGVENTPTSNELEERLDNLTNYFTYSLYKNICRSLFERHKLLFSFLMTTRIIEGNKDLDMEGYRWLLGGIPNDKGMCENPTSWIAENSWPEINKNLAGMEHLASGRFKGVLKQFIDNPDEWKAIYDSSDPQEEPFPSPWNENANLFDKIMFMKTLRPDKVTNAVQNYIDDKMGTRFIEVPIVLLSECFEDSGPTIPLIFILSQGSDPKGDFDKFADELGMRNVSSISLGQGQGERAEKMIDAAVRSGGWVLLQNCHLAASWMSSLESICENLSDSVHKDFRLWLTSMPSDRFPIPVLQNSVKMTIEPPQGLKANLKKSYAAMDDKELNECKKPDIYKKLLFGLCFFHAIIQDRRKFGPIGWNIGYEFTFEDHVVCKKQLRLFLDEYADIPYKVINFICSEINYGGRVTDDKDLR